MFLNHLGIRSAREVTLSVPYYQEVPGHSLLSLTLEFVRRLLLREQVISDATGQRLKVSSSPWFSPKVFPLPSVTTFSFDSHSPLIKPSSASGFVEGEACLEGICSVPGPSVKYLAYQVQTISNHEISLLGTFPSLKPLKL